MKMCFTIFWLCLVTALFGQSDSTECAANAGADRSICYFDNMFLSAEFNDTHNPSPNIQWTYVSGPLDTSELEISLEHAYNTPVLNLSGSPSWPIGEYHFLFCVDCKDLNNNTIHDRPCDEVVITVKPDVTTPVITEMDGSQDGSVVACTDASFGLNNVAPGETVTVYITPDDGLIDTSIVNGVLYVYREDTYTSNQGECDYVVHYEITNGGCIKKTSVNVRFIKPYDPNNDGIIEGSINSCPSCTDTLLLFGGRPGCGGIGKWTLKSGPGIKEVLDYDESTGYAWLVVAGTGNYTFAYEVTNIAPCPDSYFELNCTVNQIGSFSIGYGAGYAFCDDVIPAGTYTLTVNDLDNAVYQWNTNNPGVQIVSPNSHTTDVIFLTDLPTTPPITINVGAYKYFVDDDCDGPNPPKEVVLPTPDDPSDDWNFIYELMQQPEICLSTCSDGAQFKFYGTPKAEVEAEDIYFLCTNGSKFVKLSDYFEVTNLNNYFTEISAVDFPVGVSFPINIPKDALLELEAIGCGRYEFEIDVISYSYGQGAPVYCTTTVNLKFYVQEAQPVSAGTDQIKCKNELILLNGNNPYAAMCGNNNLTELGTWTQVNCSPCLADIAEPHNPNTRILLGGEVPPVDLYFEWSFTGYDSCGITDTTHVIVNDCIVPCSDLHVTSVCTDSNIVLTILDNNNYILDDDVYDITWSFSPLQINPITVPYTSPFTYTVNVSLPLGDRDTCITELAGLATCDTVPPPPVFCQFTIEESCDDCGNIIVKVVDLAGNTVPYTAYLNDIDWVVYGSGSNDPSGISVPNTNPIIIQEDACYSLEFAHYYYNPNKPMIPGTHDSICAFSLPKTCPSISCEGPCSDFSGFFIAGCGDDLATSLGLVFPANCRSVCGNATQVPVTLGVFDANNNNNPVTDPTLHVLWENGATGAYATAQLADINTVTITNKLDTCCEWSDGYKPTCLCTDEPQSIECQLPITKYCREDGSYYFVPGVPQISWFGITGATGYVLEITFGNTGNCCTPSALPGPQYITVTSSPWVIPAGWDCFSIRIKATNPDGAVCTESEWSAPYVYCPNRITCSPLIIICGCCGEERSAATANLPTQVVSEDALLAYLKAYPGTEYVTLQEALTAAGITVAEALDVTVFPNPADAQIVVQFSRLMQGKFTVRLTDMLQREWRTAEIDATQNNTLNVRDVPNGMYLIRVEDAKGTLVLAQKITILR